MKILNQVTETLAGNSTLSKELILNDSTYFGSTVVQSVYFQLPAGISLIARYREGGDALQLIDMGEMEPTTTPAGEGVFVLPSEGPDKIYITLVNSTANSLQYTIKRVG